MHNVHFTPLRFLFRLVLYEIFCVCLVRCVALTVTFHVCFWVVNNHLFYFIFLLHTVWSCIARRSSSRKERERKNSTNLPCVFFFFISFIIPNKRKQIGKRINHWTSIEFGLSESERNKKENKTTNKPRGNTLRSANGNQISVSDRFNFSGTFLSHFVRFSRNSVFWQFYLIHREKGGI